MRTRTLRRTTLTLLAVPAMAAWMQTGTPLRLQPASRLWVSGTSTVRSFECEAKTLNVTADAADPDAVAGVLAGDKQIATVELTVPADKLDCGNGTMNEHMLKALKSSEFKDIAFRLTSYDLNAAGEGMAATLAGTLTLGGVTKAITIGAAAKSGANGVLVVSGKYELNMTDYGIKPPSLMLGTMKVRPAVLVNFELLLKQ